MLQNLFARFFKKTPRSDKAPPKPALSLEATIPDTPVSFGYKCNWFTVSTTDTEKLATTFGLKDATPCNWEYGVSYAYEDRFFISPPVDGWTFIISQNLPYAEDPQTVALIKTMLTDLSMEFGQAQYFGTLRTAGYDSWIKAENGQIIRAYSLVDGTNTIVEGEQTPVEQKYKLINTLSEEYENDPDYLDKVEWPDESITMEIAGAWSIDPQDLENRNEISPTLGLLGRYY
jgi:hypothetical protein